MLLTAVAFLPTLPWRGRVIERIERSELLDQRLPQGERAAKIAMVNDPRIERGLGRLLDVDGGVAAHARSDNRLHSTYYDLLDAMETRLGLVGGGAESAAERAWMNE